MCGQQYKYFTEEFTGGKERECNQFLVMVSEKERWELSLVLKG